MYACETIRDVSKIDKELKKYLKEIKEKYLNKI
jgi:chromosomal replication initiator protein